MLKGNWSDDTYDGIMDMMESIDDFEFAFESVSFLKMDEVNLNLVLYAFTEVSFFFKCKKRPQYHTCYINIHIHN